MFFPFLYNFDNKYTSKCQQPINGILDLKESNNKYNFLIYDWEYYPDNFYTPDNFNNNRPSTYMEYVSIGQRSSMTENSAFGKGTYRLTLLLPDREKEYAVLMPEIFSAYDFYINDKLALQMGNIKNNNAEIQNRLVTFYGKDKVQFVINVSSFSHFYSGIVYPPALGSPKDINTLRGINILITIFIFSFSFICFFISLYIGIVMKDVNINLFTVLAFVFSIYSSCFLVHSYFSLSSELPYIIEISSCYVLYTLIVILQNNITNVSYSVKKYTSIISLIMCVMALTTALFSQSTDIHIREYISVIVELYKWLCALYILITTCIVNLKSPQNYYALFFGTVFFAASLAFDRIYPLYEPIYGCYFAEIGIISLVLSFGYILCKDLASSFKFKIKFEEEQRQIKKQLAIHQTNYEIIKKNIEETRKIRHDIRQHLRVISELASDNNTFEIKKYISTLENISTDSSAIVFSKNTTINAILQYYSQICVKNLITFNINFNAQKETVINETDITIILGNLIENSIEACLKQITGKREIELKGNLTYNDLIFRISNTISSSPKKKGNYFLSSKINTSGIGLRSVSSVVDKYKGILDIEYNNDYFIVSGNINKG